MFNFEQQIWDELGERTQRLIQEARILDAVMNGFTLPKELEYVRCLNTSYTADVLVSCTAKTLDDAFKSMESFKPLPLYLCKDSCMSIRPETKSHHKRDSDSMVRTLIHPYKYEVDGLLGHRETKTLEYFILVNGFTVKIKVEVLHDPSTQRRFTIDEYQGGRSVRDTSIHYTDVRFNKSAIMGRGTTEHPNRVYIWKEYKNEA